MSIKIIACLDMNFGIGDIDGDLLYNLPRDLKHFKSMTSGKVCVFGRKTFNSLPIKPLPNRKSYILTRDKSFSFEGVKVIHSIEEILKMSKTKDIYVCGGSEVYEQLLPYADEMFLTHVHHVSRYATSFFPDYEDKEWKPISMVKNEKDEQHRHSFTFAHYARANKEQQEKTNNE